MRAAGRLLPTGGEGSDRDGVGAVGSGATAIAAPPRRAWRRFTRGQGPRFAIGVLAVLVLAAVFLSYFDPHLAVDLANRVWACV